MQQQQQVSSAADSDSSLRPLDDANAASPTPADDVAVDSEAEVERQHLQRKLEALQAKKADMEQLLSELGSLRQQRSSGQSRGDAGSRGTARRANGSDITTGE